VIKKHPTSTQQAPNKLKSLAEAIYHVSEQGESKYDSIQNIEEILKVVYRSKNLTDISLDLKEPYIAYEHKLIEFIEANPVKGIRSKM
jgi:hypothetical protein